MKVLWVTPSMPHPLGAGGAHEFELIGALAPRHEIRLVSTEQGSGTSTDALEELGVVTTRVPWTPFPYPGNRVALATAMLRASPTLVQWLHRDRIAQLLPVVREELRIQKPDLVQLCLGELAPVLAETAEVPAALLLFDCMTRDIENRLTVERLARRKVQLRVERARTRRYERDWYRKARGVASVSSVDAAWLERLVGAPVEVIENPIAESFFVPPDRARRPNVVTFVGSLFHQPNIDAIEWLVGEIWPIIASVRPDAELVVVGRGDDAGTTAARLRTLVEHVGGRVDVDVDDIVPYYWEAAAVIAPLRFGTGLRNKVLHAMACGAPVVASSAAIEGVPLAAASAALVADGAPALAQAVLEVLDHPDQAEARARASVAAVAELRTAYVAKRLEAWWESVVSGDDSS